MRQQREGEERDKQNWTVGRTLPYYFGELCPHPPVCDGRTRFTLGLGRGFYANLQSEDIVTVHQG